MHVHANTPLAHIYRSLWVYSLGMHETFEEVTRHCASNKLQAVLASIWKVYGIIMETFDEEGTATALTYVLRFRAVMLLYRRVFAIHLTPPHENYQHLCFVFKQAC
jgi:hypothetical protein